MYFYFYHLYWWYTHCLFLWLISRFLWKIKTITNWTTCNISYDFILFIIYYTLYCYCSTFFTFYFFSNICALHIYFLCSLIFNCWSIVFVFLYSFFSHFHSFINLCVYKSCVICCVFDYKLCFLRELYMLFFSLWCYYILLFQLKPLCHAFLL